MSEGIFFMIYTNLLQKSQKTENVTHWRYWKNKNWKIVIFFQKLIYLLFPPWTNMYVVLPFVAKVSTYQTHCFFLQNVSVWHPQKFELLARRSIEVWEVALYVFLKEMPYFLNVVKPILMNFEKFLISNFDVTHWRTVQFWGDWPQTLDIVQTSADPSPY